MKLGEKLNELLNWVYLAQLRYSSISFVLISFWFLIRTDFFKIPIIKMYYQDMVRELAQLLQNGGVSCISFNGLGLSRFYDHYSRLYFEICGHLYNHYYSSPHHERYCEKGVSNNIDSWTHYFVDIRAYFVFRRNISENCFWIFIGISFSHSKIFKDDWT